MIDTIDGVSLEQELTVSVNLLSIWSMDVLDCIFQTK